jgi:hypothetical protein
MKPANQLQTNEIILVSNKSNTTGSTCGAGTTYPYKTSEFTHGFYICSFLCNVL